MGIDVFLLGCLTAIGHFNCLHASLDLLCVYLTVDHIVPLNKMTPDQWTDGTALDPSNLRTLCRVCNGTRQDKELIRVSWINSQIAGLIPQNSIPSFLR